MFAIQCPSCAAKLTAKAQPGRAARCPKCGVILGAPGLPPLEENDPAPEAKDWRTGEPPAENIPYQGPPRKAITMASLGPVLLVLGTIGLIYACFMPTAVSAGSESFQNLGLLSVRLNWVIVSCFLITNGLMCCLCKPR